MKTLADMFERNVRFFPDTKALVFEDRRVSYRQLAGRARRLSSALYRGGLRHQDRVAVLAMNCVEYFDAFAACHTTSFILATVNFRLASAEILYILQDSAPAALIFEAQYADAIAGLRAQLPSIEHYVCIGALTPEWATPYEAFLGGGDAAGAPLKPEPHDISDLVYTSGTTGRPKGVARSHAGNLRLAEAMAMEMEVKTNGRTLVMMPMFHAGGISMLLATQLMSGTVVLHRTFDPEHVLRSIERERVNTVHMAPTIVQAVLDVEHIERFDLSSLDTVCYAAAPMPVPVLRRGLALLGPVFVNSWGMTEGHGTALPKTLHRPDGTPEEVKRLASVGQAVPYCEIRIVDANDQDCPAGTPGELWLQSPSNLAYYWNNSVATLEALRDGWLRTGDMAYMDDEGFVYLVDRKKDMIISGGENIYCQEVEQALMTHPDVVDAAVIGVPDAYWGEAVKAVVVRKAGSTVSEQALIDHTGTLIARYKRPKTVDFIDSLPRLPSGKLNKVVLRQQYRAASPDIPR